MMKIKSKRDRRPLLAQEVPILSDEMPHGPSDGELDDDFNGQGKKKSWKKRVFGKGSGARRKTEDNLESDFMGEQDMNTSADLQSQEQSTQPLRMQARSPGKMIQERSTTPSTTKARSSNTNQQPPGLSEKSDYMMGSSQSMTQTANKQEMDTKKSVSTPSSTKSSRSFMRALKKKSAENAMSQTAATPVASQQPQGESHNRRTSPSKPAIKQSPATAYSPSNRMTPSSTTPSMNNAAGTPRYDVKKVLSKPFGREHILIAEQTWVVHTSRAEWDPVDSTWKYRVNIKRREGSKLQDFATCFALRSLEDFAWLEQALQTEFFGGLMLPNLSIYLGLPDIMSCQHEVDSQLLSNWLSDTLNGIRGQGEIVLSLDKVDVTASESVEAFLYRSELLAPLQAAPKSNKNSDTTKKKLSEKDANWSFLPDMCYINCLAPKQQADYEPTKKVTYSNSPNSRNPSTNISFVEPASFDNVNRSLTVHVDLVKAERDLIWSWRTRALQAMEKLSILREQEKHIGAAWKRFAISVSNLFAFEKDIETARLGDSKSRRDLQIPYRKLQKSTVDECLRILTRHKLERSTPSVDAIYVMLSTYVADLSMVQPSVAAYVNGLKDLAAQRAKVGSLGNDPFNEGVALDPSETFADKLQASINVVKKQLLHDESNGVTVDERRIRKLQQAQIENRILTNEALLKKHMTTLCRTAPVRTSRMIYAYLEKELEQCKSLHKAAEEMKSNINVASKETLSKMIHRHHTESKEDKEGELRLVHKIVNIGNTKKFVNDQGDDNSQEVEKGVELSSEIAEQETIRMKQRDKAMNDCRSRIGRWDAKLAMAIMEAVGVSDANVRVEETTRDLRMVRKYAITLRENLERCCEGLEALKLSILQGGMGDIRDIRADFMAEMKDLLSFAYVPVGNQADPLPSQLMEREGINLSDPAGWNSNDRGSCGNALNAYIETRDSGTDWLLESLGELLKEYTNRVEAIESFVYMECVGIQLEKHFSQARAAALTAFEKKTDITSAINIATRKKMPALVKELQGKLENLGSVVSHTTVKEAKEAHLESKILKQDLHKLAMRRLARARETSTERAIALMTVWAKEEEGSSSTEEGIVEELILLLQESVKKDQLKFYIGASPARM